MGRGVSLPAAARYFAKGMARPSILGALMLLIAPVAIFTAGHSPHASAANTITVNSLTDPGITGDHLCSLREAITNANAKADTTSGDCAAGTGTDTIVFNLSGTIALVSNLPSIQHTLEIDGTGQAITIDGGGASQGFLNFSGVVTLNNLTIANGHTAAGNGGGVFNNGSLTVTQLHLCRQHRGGRRRNLQWRSGGHTRRQQLHLFRQCLGRGRRYREHARRDREEQHVREQQQRQLECRRGDPGQQHHGAGYQLDHGG